MCGSSRASRLHFKVFSSSILNQLFNKINTYTICKPLKMIIMLGIWPKQMFIKPRTYSRLSPNENITRLRFTQCQWLEISIAWAGASTYRMSCKHFSSSLESLSAFYPYQYRLEILFIIERGGDDAPPTIVDLWRRRPKQAARQRNLIEASLILSHVYTWPTWRMRYICTDNWRCRFDY